MQKRLHSLAYFASILGVILVNFIAQPVFAVAPDSLSILISDSRPSVGTNYTITHDQATSAQFSDNDTLVLTWPSGFDLTALSSPNDFDFLDGSNDKTVQSGACGATDSVRAVVSGQTVTFTACTAYTESSAGAVIVIKIGTNATTGATGTHQITNHATPATYTISSDTTDEDSKNGLIVITTGVTVSATIAETLTFTVSSRTTTNCDSLITGGTENNDSTSTTVPFGTVSSDTFYNECQRLTTGTNASGGYSTTVTTTTRPTSGSNTIAKGTCDGSCSDTTTAAWNTSTNNGYGYCMKDQTGDGAATADGTGWATANQCAGGSQGFKTIARVDNSDTPRAIMASGVATSTNDVSDIGYRLSVGSGQAAGTYTTIIIYVCTATF